MQGKAIGVSTSDVACSWPSRLLSHLYERLMSDTFVAGHKQPVRPLLFLSAAPSPPLFPLMVLRQGEPRSPAVLLLLLLLLLLLPLKAATSLHRVSLGLRVQCSRLKLLLQVLHLYGLLHVLHLLHLLHLHGLHLHLKSCWRQYRGHLKSCWLRVPTSDSGWKPHRHRHRNPHGPHHHRWRHRRRD